jgi:hypothetical protein
MWEWSFWWQVLELGDAVTRLSVIHVAGTKGKVRRLMEFGKRPGSWKWDGTTFGWIAGFFWPIRQFDALGVLGVQWLCLHLWRIDDAHGGAGIHMCIHRENVEGIRLSNGSLHVTSSPWCSWTLSLQRVSSCWIFCVSGEEWLIFDTLEYVLSSELAAILEELDCGVKRCYRMLAGECCNERHSWRNSELTRELSVQHPGRWWCLMVKHVQCTSFITNVQILLWYFWEGYNTLFNLTEGEMWDEAYLTMEDIT